MGQLHGIELYLLLVCISEASIVININKPSDHLQVNVSASPYLTEATVILDYGCPQNFLQFVSFGTLMPKPIPKAAD